MPTRNPPDEVTSPFWIWTTTYWRVLRRSCAQRIAAAKFYGVGGFRRATLAFYDMEAKRYFPIDVEEQVEVVSIIGNVAAYHGAPRIHAHCVVGHRDGRTTGGHLLSAVVRPTLELAVEEITTELRRTDRPEIGIPLLDF